MTKHDFFRLAVELVSNTSDQSLTFSHASTCPETVKRIKNAYNAVKTAWEEIPDKGMAGR